MSTIRATYVQHGSSAVPNITLNASGQVIVASGIVSSGTFAAPSGTAAAPGVYFVGDADTGLYSPGANQVAIATSGTGKVFIDSNGNVGVGASSPVNFTNYKTITAQGVTTGAGGVYASQTSDASTQALYYTLSGEARLGTTTSTPFAFLTNNFERVRITSAGNVGIGLSTPTAILHTYANIGGGNPSTSGTTDANVATRFQAGSVYLDVGVQTAGHVWLQPRLITDFAYNFNLMLCPNGGNVSIGSVSTNPLGKLYIESPAASAGWSVLLQTTGISNESGFYRDASNNFEVTLRNGGGGLAYIKNGGGASTPHLTFNIPSEAARIDSSGRLLVGTSSSRGGFFNNTSGFDHNFQIEGTLSASFVRNEATGNGAFLTFGKTRGSSAGATTAVVSGDELGSISFQGADGSKLTEAVRIFAAVDGTPGTNDMPGRLVFSTTADGASSPTERMRINANGGILLQKTVGGLENTGFEHNNHTFITRNGDIPLYINRLTDDGTLIEFRQASAPEGSISVSGTTVSYNGAHLSRWSQLPSGAERVEILRGTILSNIDEMCEWGDEENEQLNRMKVSDVEGDKNVSGVFQAWDDDDDTYTNDFYCAMTGDFIIRIAAGVTVERGDLLMSAGDGTAKPQGDGYVQDKTVAKVTSTHITCTYDDGSYCVPCVLMAC